mmetsp:Transcript_12655/g.44633  ORF Transcript_12655/g.44633 Transcript_12655/m.44633 type:complete len:225 (-) Transcript_12655:410-1084(-)
MLRSIARRGMKPSDVILHRGLWRRFRVLGVRRGASVARLMGWMVASSCAGSLRCPAAKYRAWAFDGSLDGGVMVRSRALIQGRGALIHGHGVGRRRFDNGILDSTSSPRRKRRTERLHLHRQTEDSTWLHDGTPSASETLHIALFQLMQCGKWDAASIGISQERRHFSERVAPRAENSRRRCVENPNRLPRIPSVPCICGLDAAPETAPGTVPRHPWRRSYAAP